MRVPVPWVFVMAYLAGAGLQILLPVRAASPAATGVKAPAGAGASALLELNRVPAADLGRGFERWRMIGPGRDTVTGLWRAPARRRSGMRGDPPRAAEWTVVILGGVGTDDAAALLVPDTLPVGVLAVSWPWKGPRRMSQAEFVANAPAIRAALLHTPEALARGVAAVRRASPGTRVAMVGASLGVPPAVAAIPLVRVEALVLVDGAADLERLLQSEARRAIGEGVVAGGLAGVSASLAAWMVAPLEPSRHAGAARNIPTLLVDAEREERLPRACVARLHAIFPHATLARHPGGHLRPENREQINSTLATTWRWLDGIARATGTRTLRGAGPGQTVRR